MHFLNILQRVYNCNMKSRLIYALIYGAVFASFVVSGSVALLLSGYAELLNIEPFLLSVFSTIHIGVSIVATITFLVVSFIVFMFRREVDDTYVGRAIASFSWLLIATLVSIAGFFIIKVL